MIYINRLYYITTRMWKKLYYRPIHLALSFVQPIFWLTIFGYLFEDKFDFQGNSYMTYLLPGVCAMTVLQSSAQSGIQFIKDIKTGFFGRYNFTPASKVYFLFCKILADYSRIIVQMLFICIIGCFLGVKSFSISFASMIWILMATMFFTFFYASISCLIALKTKTSELLASFIHLFNLPIIFTSTALIPNKNLPSWLSEIAAYNPLSYLTEILRHNLLPQTVLQSLEPFGFYVLILLGLVCFGICSSYLRNLKYV
jgi:ABC-2 type transport system permease protein